MELNREQIIKALECCSEDTADCHNCPYSEFQEGNCFDNAKKDALSLIKELTEEVTSWKEIAEGYQKQFEDCAEDRARLTEENERLKQLLDYKCLYGYDGEVMEYCVQGPCPHYEIKKELVADTVRKMQERLKEKAFSVPTVYNSHFGRMIDEIAKEMLEGKEICKNTHQKK